MNQQGDRWFCNDCGSLNLMVNPRCYHCKGKNPYAEEIKPNPKYSNAKVLVIVAIVAICALPISLWIESRKTGSVNPANLSVSPSATVMPITSASPVISTLPLPIQTPQAKLTRVRIVPFINPQGRRFLMVMIDWKNTGTLPIAALFARIDLYDSDKQFMSLESASSYCIFAAEKESQKIKPGEVYQEPVGDGFVVVSAMGNVASRANVEIVRVDTQLSGN